MNDPERLEELAMRKQQSELNARLPPKVKFKQVLDAAPPVAGRPKRNRPKSDQKLRPSAPAQQFVGFGVEPDADDPLADRKQKVVVKV